METHKPPKQATYYSFHSSYITNIGFLLLQVKLFPIISAVLLRKCYKSVLFWPFCCSEDGEASSSRIKRQTRTSSSLAGQGCFFRAALYNGSSTQELSEAQRGAGVPARSKKRTGSEQTKCKQYQALLPP